MDILKICQKLKQIWHFETFVSTGSYGTGDFKMLLLLQCLFDLSQTFFEKQGNHKQVIRE